jgi:hypothetical protein
VQDIPARKVSMMSSTVLYRLSGIALLLGGLFSLISLVLGLIIPGPQGQEGPSAALVALIQLLALILIVLALPGMYVKQANRAGWLGLVGFLLLSVAVILLLSHTVIDAVVVPSIALPREDPVGILALTIVSSFMAVLGSILFGSATIRAAIFPRGAGVLLILTSITLLHAVPLPMSIKTIVGLVSGVLLTLAFAWYGYTLLSGRTVHSMPSGHATAEAAR